MIILALIGLVMMLLGGGTAIATHFGGTDVFAFLLPDMSSYIKIFLSPITGMLYGILTTIQENQVGLLWYGLLILVFCLLIMFRGLSIKAYSMLAAVAKFLSGLFLVCGLTGFVYHFFTDYPPMTVAELSDFFGDKLILWPWNVLSGMENVFIRYRVTLLIAAVLWLGFAIALNAASDHADGAASDLPYILSYVVPVLFTFIAGKIILNNVLGHTSVLQVIRDHPFFQAGESRQDFDFFRVISVYVLCAVTSFGFMRSWIDYSEVMTNSKITSWLIAAASMVVLLAAAAALVLLLFDPLALMLSSVVSMILAVVGTVVIYGLIMAMADLDERKRKRTIRRARSFRPVTEADVQHAVDFMDADDPDYLFMSSMTQFATSEQADAVPDPDEFEDD